MLGRGEWRVDGGEVRGLEMGERGVVGGEPGGD